MQSLDMEETRGKCWDCGRVLALRHDGKVRRHDCRPTEPLPDPRSPQVVGGDLPREHETLGGGVTRTQGRMDREAWVSYHMPSGHAVRVTLDLATGAEELSIKGGTTITTALLRSLPLNDAGKVLRRLREEHVVERDSRSYDMMPERMDTPADWKAFEQAYARAMDASTTPAKHLSQKTGVSVNTINARFRRARQLGYLDWLS